MAYVIIYEDENKQIKNEVVESGFTKRILEIEALGGYFLRVMKEEDFNKQQQLRKRKVSGWNQ